jgi:hypothetical protein
VGVADDELELDELERLEESVLDKLDGLELKVAAAPAADVADEVALDPYRPESVDDRVDELYPYKTVSVEDGEDELKFDKL